MRTVMIGLLMLVLLTAGCSGDDDDTADDAATTTAESPATTVAEWEVPAEQLLTTTTFPPAEEIDAWPTYQVGESALVGPDLTLTITGLEADPELPREPSIPLGDGERYVLVRGTVDYTGPIQDDAIVSVGTQSVLVPAEPAESVAYDPHDNGCAEVYPDIDTSVFPAETWDQGWCYAVPADRASWKFVLDPVKGMWLVACPTNAGCSDGSDGYEFVWDVSLETSTPEA
ncbi:MAG: hypothetical protein ACERLM_07195 [Acidimicrobiales bacterium]